MLQRFYFHLYRWIKFELDIESLDQILTSFLQPLNRSEYSNEAVGSLIIYVFYYQADVIFNVRVSANIRI